MRALLERIAAARPTRVIYDQEGGKPYLSRTYLGKAPTHPDGGDPFDPLGDAREGIIWPEGVQLYLHHFHRSDMDPELHNHPWAWGTSLILAGGYLEERRVGTRVLREEYLPGSFNVIKADTFHRVELLEADCWSLFLAGPKTSSWGFWSRETWIFTPWREFLADKRRAASESEHLAYAAKVRYGLPREDEVWQGPTKNRYLVDKSVTFSSRGVGKEHDRIQLRLVPIPPSVCPAGTPHMFGLELELPMDPGWSQIRETKPVEQALNEHESDPTPGKVAVWPLVIADMKARDEIGRERYGTPLETENGRNALVDAYQEQLDHMVYLRQLIEEKGFDVLPLPPRHKLAAEVDRLRARETELLESNSKLVLERQADRGLMRAYGIAMRRTTGFTDASDALVARCAELAKGGEDPEE